MAITIRELVTKLGVKTDRARLTRFDTALGKTKRMMATAARGTRIAAKAFAAFGVAVGIAGAAVFKFTENVASMGDQLAKDSKRIGLSAGTLKQLQFAAERSGASADSFTKGMLRMAKALSDLQLRGTGPLADQLKDLGIDFSEFKDVTPEQALSRFADIAASIEDPLRRAAFAQDVFGKGGKDLIPLLMEGSQGIASLRAEAQRFGFTMSDETAVASEQFMDSLTNLKSSLEGLKITIGAELIPVVRVWIDNLTEWVVKNRDLVAEKVLEFLRKLIRFVQRGAEIIGNIVSAIENFIASLGGLDNALLAVVGTLGALKIAILAATNPWGALIAGAAAAGAAIGLFAGDAINDIRGVTTEIDSLNDRIRAAKDERDRLRRETEQLDRQTELSEKVRRRQTAGFEDILDKSTAGFAPGMTSQAFDIQKQITKAQLDRAKRAGEKARKAASRKGASAAEQRRAMMNARNREMARLEAAEVRTRQAASQAALAGGGAKDIGKAIRGSFDVGTGMAKPRRGGGGKRAAQAEAQPEAATDEELLGLIERAAPGTDLSELTGGRRVPRVQAPVVTVTINQTNVTQEIDAPVTVTGVPGTSAEDVARLVERKQRQTFGEEIRKAIEVLQPVEVV